MPLVSVIVPNYNHAPFLRLRLDSIFNQTFQDFEVIILDDCSTDNSKEIIEEYRNRPQVSHVVYNETNSGSPFKQWAKGFDLAQGEYIWIAESDDWAELAFLEVFISVLRTNPSIAIAFCESFWEHPDKTLRRKFLKMPTLVNGINFIKTRQVISNTIINASSVVFRKKNLQAIPKDYQMFIGSGDYIFWSYLCETGDVCYVKKYLNHFRRNSFTTTSRCIANGSVFFENHKIYEHFKNKNFISPFANYRIIDKMITQIKANKKDLIKSGCYQQCYLLWKTELKTSGMLSRILFFCAHQANKYENLPLYAKIWTILHLPNTDFRDRIRNILKRKPTAPSHH